jgi:hypothetical protein
MRKIARSISSARIQSLLPVPLFVTILLSITAPALGQETLFFGSDVHGDTATLSSLMSQGGGSYELGGIVGDLGSNTTSTLFSNIKNIIAGFGATPVTAQGNHDGVYHTHATGPVTDLNGNENYDVYVINWEDFSSASTVLDSYLASYADGKAIFVISHVPLHSTRSGIDQSAAADIFDTLQYYSETLDIVFLWGHNHSSSSYDVNVDYVALPGERVNKAYPTTGTNLIGYVANEVLNFTYLNAGYVDATSSSTVITVDGDTIDINRFGNKPESVTVDRINTVPTSELSAIGVTANPTKMSYTVGAGFDPSGMVVTANYVDGTTKAVSRYEYTTTVPENGEIIISYTEGDVTASTTLWVTVVTAIDDVAQSEIKVTGTVTGTYTNTQAIDGVIETIKEAVLGSYWNRYSALEHKWVLSVTGGSSVVFYVNAWHSTNTESDHFTFAYSINNSTYTNMLTVTKTANDGAYQSYALPAGTSGTVTVRVTDTNRSRGKTYQDTITVDHLLIRSE